MKKHFKQISKGILTFCVFTLITIRCGGSHDGMDEIGFPAVFYNDTGGKRLSYEGLGFHLENLVIDFILAFIIVYVFNFLGKINYEQSLIS